jgi:hypothetical protein
MKETHFRFLKRAKELLDEVAATLNRRAQALEDFTRGHDQGEV